MMIAVIADDLTGAAEIGGIGLKYNLSVEITTGIVAATDKDMLVVNTDARSKSEADAIAITSELSRQLKACNPQLLFKKIDSVMRGHVIPEINAQCEAMDISRALIVSANPALGRTLINGHYLIHDIPVHETSFRHDPEFPVTESHVQTRFANAQNAVTVQPHTAPLPQTGIIVGETHTDEDLHEWALQLQTDTLAVGASGFFTACLDALQQKAEAAHTTEKHLQQPVLYVSGSTFKQSAALVNNLHKSGGPVSYMPAGIMQSTNPEPAAVNYWTDEIITRLKEQGKAVMAIPQDEQAATMYDARHLRKQMALAVKCIFENTTVLELIIEGGSTAAAILEELDINSIFPVQELSAGVIRNAVASSAYPDLHITLKPGSYSWSSEAWAF
ncbi:four-carbon acid sugar kinase family protein [Mucilaginibacter sp. PAMB04168]|uniref:four-carbon acid sugar kinase family protein n=1 Tax=Mucilaginibacter sp. PAMB04168 TaxID=3138567 RepID=UPI0031F6290B